MKAAQRIGAAALVLALLAGGAWLFVDRVTRYADLQERSDLHDVAFAAAASLEPQTVSALTATPADSRSAQFADLRSDLRRIHDSIPDLRFAYLVTLRKDEVVFLADGEPAESPQYSPPGQVFTEAPPMFREAFTSGTAMVYGPYADRWGNWITAVAPVRDPATRRVIALMAVDVDATHFRDEVSAYTRVAVAIASLFATSLALFAAIVWLMRRFNARLRDDVAELRRAQEKLQLAGAVIENSSEGMMVTDGALRIESVNPAFERITGYSAAEVIGKKPRILFSGRHNDDFFHRLHLLVDGRGAWRGEIWNRRRDGSLYAQLTSITTLRNGDGRITHYASVFNDNTAQNQLEAKLRDLSSLDGLTGIANRRMFDEVLAREWTRALREKRPLSMLMADIDFFKSYNDRYGHLAGDECLKKVAAAIRAVASRSSDLTARYGGEEFAVILPTGDATSAAQMAEKVRAAVANLGLPHEKSKTAPHVTISVGVATLIPTQTDRHTDLIAAADRALYEAKGSGRNRVAAACEPTEIAAN